MHDFFGDLYAELHGSIDDIAEQIRTLDSFAPSTLGRMIELAEDIQEDEIQDIKDLIEFKNIINSDYKSRRIDSNFKLKRLPFIKKTYNNSLTNLLNIALLKYFERLKKYKINCNYNNLNYEMIL